MNRKYTEETVELIRSMIGEYGIEEIAARVGMSRSGVYGIIKRNGIDVKSRLDEARRSRAAKTSPCTVCAKSSEDCVCIVWKNWFTHQWKEVCRRIWTAVGKVK